MAGENSMSDAVDDSKSKAIIRIEDKGIAQAQDRNPQACHGSR